MTSHRTPRRAAALAVALALTAAAAVAGVAAPALAVDDPPTQSTVDVAPDYLVDTYQLPANHVFETITFERFEWLLNGSFIDRTTTPATTSSVTGRFAFFVGHPGDANTVATIGYVDQVAKQYGVDKIYYFDPALDGDTLNIWNPSALNLNTTGKNAVAALGNRLVNSYLNKDTTPGFTKTSSDPYLFIYDKSHKVGGVEDRIVASLNVRKTVADFAAPGSIGAFKAQVGAVFDAIAVEGVAHVDQLDQWVFWKGEVNRRHEASAANGSTILNDSDGTAGWRIEAITYPQLKHLVQQEGDYVILFGGTWCHNTRAVIKQINKLAQQNGIPKVYVFDNSLDSTGNDPSNYLHIRGDAAISSGLPTRASYLYGDLWNTYFTNIVTEYRILSSEPGSTTVSPVKFYAGGVYPGAELLARKGQVPFLFEYNKDNLVGGASKPVVQQWIQSTGTGTYKEYMTEWWFTPTSGPISGNTMSKNFAAQAEAALKVLFEGLPRIPAITSVEVSAANAGGGAVALTATIFWCNSVAPDATGRVEFFEVGVGGDDDSSLGSTTVIGAGQATLTVSGWGHALREFYAVYTPSDGSHYNLATSAHESYALPAVAPAAPAAPVASVSGTSVTITWVAPDDGGSAITGYQVSLDGGTPVSVGAGVHSHVFTGLDLGDHSATVVAGNAVGSSPASPVSNTATVVPPPVVPVEPSAPPAPVASVSGTSVTITWVAPDDGGAAITGYQVSLDGATAVSVGAGVTTHTFTGVAVGSHAATVVATNAVGDSPASPASNSVTVLPPPTAPAAPAAPTASVSGSSVTIGWTTPTDGGSAITGYQVSLDGATPVSVGAGVHSYVFTGASVGGHTATVVATNAVGDSPASPASNSVTVLPPPTAPAAPAAPIASATGTSVSVTWVAPADGGSPIIGYRVSLDGGTPVSVGAGVHLHTFTAVAPGDHTATVIATNTAGDSPESPASNTVSVVDPTTVKGSVTVTGDLQQGGTITVTGTGFAESTTGFSVEIHSVPQVLGTVGTNSTGAFTFTTTIPSTVPAGSHSIVVLYNGVELSTLAVSLAADPSLAATGVDTSGTIALLIVGLATIALGGLIAGGAVVTRRRRVA